MNHVRKFQSAFVVIVVTLLLSWLAPPIVQRLKHLCPVRPDGLDEALAVPSFSREYQIACTECHVAWPVLNDYGRKFKNNGFRFDRGATEGSMEVKTEPWPMILKQVFPWGAIVRSRPLDVVNTPTGRKSLTPFNDLDMFIGGGNIAKDLTIWGEIDIPAGGGFVPTPTGDMMLGYHPFEQLNIQYTNNRSFYELDPYQTLPDMGGLTVTGKAFANTGSSSTVTMNSKRQIVSIYGDFAKEGIGMLFYRLGVGSDINNASQGPWTFSARIALDSLKGVMIGGFSEFGESGWLNNAIAATPNTSFQFATMTALSQQGNESVARFKYVRSGVDALVNVSGLYFKTAFLTMYDRDNANDPVVGPIVFANYDPTQPRDQYNRATYLEAFYTVRKGDLPVLIPLLRYDWWESFNKTQTNSSVTAQIGSYLRPNMKIFLEYSSVLNGTSFMGWGPAGTGMGAKDSRWMLQGEVGF